MKTTIFIVLKVAALTAILFICFAVAGGVTGLQDSSPAPENAGAAAGLLLADCFLCTLVLTYLVLRSRWAGWRLAATVFLVFYGVMTFMSQIETTVFVTRLPAGTLARLFLMGALIAAPFTALAVLVLGNKGADVAGDLEHNSRLLLPAGQWAWRLVALALAYLILYFTFGYFIAWRDPAVPAYYGGVDEGTFLARMSVVLTDTFWLIPFQILRALLWVAIALPVVRTMKGRWPETALTVGLLFAVLMSAQLLLPNPYMPEAVRMAHLKETASSNFIFGFLVGWLLTPRHESAKLL